VIGFAVVVLISSPVFVRRSSARVLKLLLALEFGVTDSRSVAVGSAVAEVGVTVGCPVLHQRPALVFGTLLQKIPAACEANNPAIRNISPAESSRRLFLNSVEAAATCLLRFSARW
jgi:hypothetical protein